MEDLPQGLRYTVDHVWVRNDGQSLFTIGLTEPAQLLLGNVLNIDLPNEGDSFDAGDDCAVIESIKTSNDIFMPLSGDVIAVNDELIAEPELINNAPYGEGWLLQILISNPSELDDLLDAQSYNTMLENYVENENDENEDYEEEDSDDYE